MGNLFLKILAYLGLWILWIPISFLLTFLIMTPYILIRAIFDPEKYGKALSCRFKNVWQHWDTWGYLLGPPF